MDCYKAYVIDWSLSYKKIQSANEPIISFVKLQSVTYVQYLLNNGPWTHSKVYLKCQNPYAYKVPVKTCMFRCMSL